MLVSFIKRASELIIGEYSELLHTLVTIEEETIILRFIRIKLC